MFGNKNVPKSSIVNTDIFLYKDLPYHGLFSADSVNLVGPTAFKNAFKMFIMSQKGDYGRDIQKGGILIEFLGKPLTDEYEIDLKNKIYSSAKEFSSFIEILDVKIERDLMENKWIVNIYFANHEEKYTDVISTTFKV